MAGRLDGEVALISGASRGQGEAEARMFAREDRGIEQTSLGTWHKTLAVNQTGVFLGIKYAIPGDAPSWPWVDCQHLFHRWHCGYGHVPGVSGDQRSSAGSHQECRLVFAES